MAFALVLRLAALPRFPVLPIAILCAVAVMATLPFGLWLETGRALGLLIYVQFVLDLVLLTIGFYWIGNVTVLLRMQFLMIIIPCALLSPLCGMLMAVLSTVSHLALARLHTPPLSRVELIAPVFFYFLIAHQCLFYGRRLAAKTREAEDESIVASALLRVAQELAAAPTSAALVQRLAECARDIVPVEWAGVLILDPARAIYRVGGIASRTGFLDDEITTIDLPVSDFAPAVTSRDGIDCVEVHSADDSFAPRWLHERWRFDACLAAPLRRAGEPLGILVIGAETEGKPFNPTTRRLVMGMAHAAVLALDNARLVDDLRASSSVKSEFIGTMSHELRSPLHAILGYTEMLGDVCEGAGAGAIDERRDLLKRVHRHSVDLLEMVEATLDVSRMQTAHLPVTRTTVALDALFADVRANLPEHWQKPQVTFTWGVGPLPVVEVDAGKLRTIVRNLVQNALKFTDEGSVTVDAMVSLDVARRSVTNGLFAATCTVVVTDTGIGITADVRPTIFDMFRQGDATLTRRYGGVGLGLYIVKRMVDAVEGTISIDSEAGKGSRFEVRLPVRLLAADLALSA